MAEPGMKIRKKFEITGLILTPNNIMELAEVFRCELEHDLGQDEDSARLNFTFVSRDGTQYDGDFDSIFEGNYLQNRPICKISMSFSNYKKGKSISLEIGDSSSRHTSNECEVVGRNEQWVNGIKTTIEEIINSFEKRNIVARLIYKHDFISFIIFFGSLQLLAQSPFNSLTTELLRDGKTFSSALALMLFITIFAGLFFLPLYKMFKFIFPEIELRLGQDHHQTQKKFRKAAFFVLFILIPSIIALVSFWPILQSHITN